MSEKNISLGPAIEATGLVRSFKRRIREPGLRSAVNAFFRPTYATKTAVDGMNFSVPRGLCVGIVGANGAGKTTLLKMIAGLLHPTSGKLQVLGHEPARRNREYQKRIGMVMGQKSQLWIDIPAAETFELLASIYEVPEAVYKTRVAELARTFQVDKLLGVQVRRLSLGERMKLEIMAALLHEPELLILDEPTIGLDVVSKRTIRRFIREHNRDHGTTILLSSHDMTDISEVCEKLLLVSNGRIVFDGNVRDFKSHGESSGKENERDVAFLFDLNAEPAPAELEALCRTTGARVLASNAGELKLRVEGKRLGELVGGVFRLATPLDLKLESTDLETLVHEVMSR